MAETYYPLSDAAFGRIKTKLGQMRLGGQTVTPAMLTALYQGELGAADDQALRRRALSLEEERFNKNLAESTRRFDEEMSYKEDALKSGELAGWASTAVNLPVAGWAGYKAYKTLLGGGGKPPSPSPGYDMAMKTPTYDVPIPTPVGEAPMAVGPYEMYDMPMPESVSFGEGGSYLAGTPEASEAMTGMWAQAEPVVATDVLPVTGFGEKAMPVAAYSADVGAVGEGAAMGAPAGEAVVTGTGEVATTTAGTPLLSYAAPVGAGAIGGKFGEQAGKWIGEQLDMGGEKEREFFGGMGGGAAAGAAIGSVVPGVGTAVGAIVGAVTGGVQSLIDDTVICTALHKLGMIPTALYFADGRYGASLPEHIREGYWLWAKPLADCMLHHPFLAKIVRWAALPVITEMAHRTDRRFRSSLVGRIGLEVGLRVCGVLGRIRGEGSYGGAAWA